MQPLSQHLARTLKALRAQRQWSLTQAAERSGVSKAMLGQIERGESSPTVATLWKIATGFEVPFSLFITAPESDPGVVHYSEGDRPPFRQPNEQMRVTPLINFDAQLGFDLLEIEFAPGAFSASAPHAPGVIEHVVVIRGQLAVQVAQRWRRLKATEVLRFPADAPHAYRNDGSEPALIHDLIHYPRPG
ncbi:helix-turn-helix domain-containing protein [Mixta tenebrionis]|uniref:Helix-turn-helix domain-containing protein n=1 Tax=Mixta tenebrionis TaxID=2562439 RepID=A0A506VCW4_9GAMM|nr:XRE family transcriptional regulator [Mixta tenebrionis]TPW43362.1 helix-turn-helix domain-containing protein [Mixta tenebrionis]